MARLEEAVAAYRETLKERTRGAAPLSVRCCSGGTLDQLAPRVGLGEASAHWRELITYGGSPKTCAAAASARPLSRRTRPDEAPHGLLTAGDGA
jgi:hypothetical protein